MKDEDGREIITGDETRTYEDDQESESSLNYSDEDIARGA